MLIVKASYDIIQFLEICKNTDRYTEKDISPQTNTLLLGVFVLFLAESFSALLIFLNYNVL